MGDLGLVIGLGADPSEVQSAIDQLEIQAGRAGDAVAATGGKTKKLSDDVDKGLLSNRESARLLTEEMGVHLPRAVTGAAAEIIPALGSIGPVLLGVFAVEEVPKIVGGIRDLANEWEGFGKAEQKAMAKAIEDTGKLRREVLSVEHELDLFGKKEAEQAAMRAQWASEDADAALQNLFKAEKAVADLNDKVKEAKKGAGVFAADAGGAYAKQIEVATAKVNQAREAWVLADQKALLAQRRAQQAAAKEAAEEGEKVAAVGKKVHDFPIFGTGPTPEWVTQMYQARVAIDGVTKSENDWVQSITIWESHFRHGYMDELPLATRNLTQFGNVVGQVNYVLKQNESISKMAAKAM
jgi:hypothetical protein